MTKQPTPPPTPGHPAYRDPNKPHPTSPPPPPKKEFGLRRVIGELDLLISNSQLKRIEELEADKAAMLKAMQENCFFGVGKCSSCIFCEGRGGVHKPDCITQADHSGTRLLEERKSEKEEFEIEKRNHKSVIDASRGQRHAWYCTSQLVGAVCNCPMKQFEEQVADKKWYNEVMALIQTQLEAAEEGVELLRQYQYADDLYKWKSERDAVLKRYDATKPADETEEMGV